MLPEIDEGFGSNNKGATEVVGLLPPHAKRQRPHQNMGNLRCMYMILYPTFYLRATERLTAPVMAPYTPPALAEGVDCMTKAELIERVFKDNRPRRISRVAVTQMIDSAFEFLQKGIKRDGKFTYPGFGAFSVRKRKARQGRNPKTGEPITIEARKTVAFRPAPRLKQSLR